MSEAKRAEMAARRSELLATVALTRRLDINVLPVSADADLGVDFLCTIRPDAHEELQGFFPFAVVVWGTSKPITTVNEANRFARAQKKRLDTANKAYFMPVIVLLFSMIQDEGFVAWAVEPDHDSEHLMHHVDLEFAPFDLKELDRLTTAIKKWYQRLASVVISDASALASARG